MTTSSQASSPHNSFTRFPWLNDGTAYAERGDVSYAAELAPLRTALELDRFGFVAHVLGDQGCTSERCDAFMRFRDPSKVLANIRDHTFEEQVKKYTAIWDRPAGHVPVPVDCDFPCSKSISPVSITAPEEQPPREAAPESTETPEPPRPAPEAAPQTTTAPPRGGRATSTIGAAAAAAPSAPGQRPAAARCNPAAVAGARCARHAAASRRNPLAGN
jgi:hypothetical protein